MTLFLQVLVSGIATGAVYGLVALGVVVVFSTTRLLNFAQGQFAMIGGLVGWLLMNHWGLPFPVALIASILAGGACGWLLCVGLVNPMIERGADLIAVVIATFGVSIALSQLALLLMGPETRSVPAALSAGPTHLGGAVVTVPVMVIVIGAIIALGVFSWLRSRTAFGLALRAVGANRVGARVVGLNSDAVATWGFVLSGAITAVAGLLVAPTTGWTPNMGTETTLMAFVGAIVGGIASPYSAFLGGFLVGILGDILQAYYPSYATAVVFAVLIGVIAVRPSGLFPSAETATGALRS